MIKVLLLLLLTGQTQSPDRLPNAILAGLVNEGVAVGGGTVLKLPPPTLPDGLDAAGQKKSLAHIADANHPLESLLRNSAVAPFVLKIGGDETGGATSRTTGQLDSRLQAAGIERQPAKAGTPAMTGRRVDVWFIVHGDFQLITSNEFLSKEIAPDSKEDQQKADFVGHVLDGDELSARKLKLASPDERFFNLSFNLFDKVQLSATQHSLQTRTAESVVVAGQLDGRFDSDLKFPNRWQSLQRDDSGKFRTGPPQPYRGAGWYVKATRLRDPASAVLVEYHLVFDEPLGWFDGANLLRSKLPLLVQDAVRKFRRKVAAKK